MKIEKCLVYIAEDGAEFDSEGACLQHERICKLSEYLSDLIYENTSDLNRNDSEDVAGVIANNTISILAVYNKL